MREILEHHPVHGDIWIDCFALVEKEPRATRDCEGGFWGELHDIEVRTWDGKKLRFDREAEFREWAGDKITDAIWEAKERDYLDYEANSCRD